MSSRRAAFHMWRSAVEPQCSTQQDTSLALGFSAVQRRHARVEEMHVLWIFNVLGSPALPILDLITYKHTRTYLLCAYIVTPTTYLYIYNVSQLFVMLFNSRAAWDASTHAVSLTWSDHQCSAAGGCATVAYSHQPAADALLNGPLHLALWPGLGTGCCMALAVSRLEVPGGCHNRLWQQCLIRSNSVAVVSRA
jgi:hypothetical protein